ncbi:hypothetical protein WMY93_024334 [Mugilogobius chulae]|uniref:Uncharacterized protein n=1 Tax=Mugilogobius chulae TaxID=88201 RepID=A0AAW0N3R2_9GOBI
MVHTIVDCMGEFVRKSLASWLRRRGGWADVTKCVVNTDPSFRSHWLVAAACTCGHYLKAIVLYCSETSERNTFTWYHLRERDYRSLLWNMFTLHCTGPRFLH